jgi:hypothetical protein
MPSVLFVFHSHICGGIERHLLTSMQGLSARGYRIAFAGPADSWLMDQVRAQHLSGYHLPMHGMLDLWSILRLATLVRRVGADLIHSHATRGARYARFAGALTGAPVVSTAHSTDAGKHFGGANRIIAVSHAVADFLAARGYDRERILVAPEDSTGLARAIEALITDPALHARLGRAARWRYEDHFSLQPMLDATEEVYHSLLAAPHSPGLARSG